LNGYYSTNLRISSGKLFEQTSAYGAHLKSVYEDVKFRDDVEKMPPRTLDNYVLNCNRIALKYAIRGCDVDQVYDRKNAGYKTYDVQIRGIGYFLNLKPDGNGEFSVKLKGNITEKQFESLWRDMQRVKKIYGIKQKRTKGPEDTALLYAIYSQLKLKISFQTVFSLYRSGELVSYDRRKNKHFDTVKELHDYYRTYYPII
jgi:hypothetical protein